MRLTASLVAVLALLGLVHSVHAVHDNGPPAALPDVEATRQVVADGAEAAGMLKERQDMRPGGSGFSFADLLADYAGVAYAVRLRDGKATLDDAARFKVTDWVPDFAGLDDGLTAAQFEKKFGSFD